MSGFGIIVGTVLAAQNLLRNQRGLCVICVFYLTIFGVFVKLRIEGNIGRLLGGLPKRQEVKHGFRHGEHNRLAG